MKFLGDILKWLRRLQINVGLTTFSGHCKILYLIKICEKVTSVWTNRNSVDFYENTVPHLSPFISNKVSFLCINTYLYCLVLSQKLPHRSQNDIRYMEVHYVLYNQLYWVCYVNHYIASMTAIKLKVSAILLWSI